MIVKTIAERALEQGRGIVRLAPNWVPRSFCVPGRRIKLHPDDYYALGGERGGIDERWFSSTTPAVNGPLARPDEGLSYIVFQDGKCTERILMRDGIEEIKAELIGERLWNKYHGWPMYSKFFDNKGALPFHIHHQDHHASLVGLSGKPEAYYFPPQVNNHGGDYPYTFFGLNPNTTKDQVRDCLKKYTKGDNHITDFSRAYRINVATGWDVPPGLLHAPGSLCTYEPQKASDVFAMYQSCVGGQLVPEELLWKDSPPVEKNNFDYLIDVIDWELNVDPDFVAHRFMEPKPVFPIDRMQEEGYCEVWICYKSLDFCAKELTVFPNRNVVIKDAAAYGLILLQGHGKMGAWKIETPTLIRFGELTYDEFFVCESAAKTGVEISNYSSVEPLVMLKHFGPENPDLNI